MLSELLKTDKKTYLRSGVLTQPFLKDGYVLEKVMQDYNSKIKKNLPANKLTSLYNWIAANVKFSKDDEFNAKWKFQRTAKEIWESKVCTGCTDYALLFSTFARQIGVPTTILYTAEQGWLLKLKNGEEFNKHIGHAFCECFYDDKWILVDPTNRKIENDYSLKEIDLSYSINGKKVFVPYKRCLDLGKKQSMEQHNHAMDEECKNFFNEI